MSTHVVCFVVLPFIVAAWVIWRWLEARMTQLKGAAGVLLRSVGLALAGAAGTLLGFSGNLWCYFKWGEMSPWRLMTTYTDAPWYDMYMDIEYKLEETTTHLNFFEAKDSILQSYATPVGEWGLRLALVALVCVIAYAVFSRVQDAPQGAAGTGGRSHRRAQPFRGRGGGVHGRAVGAVYAAHPRAHDRPARQPAVQLFRLLPQAAALHDTMVFALLRDDLRRAFGPGGALAAAAGRSGSAARPPEALRKPRLRPAPANTCPACLCVLLCLLGVVKGTNQTGYTNTFYRYSRDVMESERILLDNGFRERYGMLMAVAEHVGEDQKILITRVGYQYPLRGRGYVLTSNPIVPLMNLPLEEVEAALAEMNVAMLATEPDFWDERYYPLSALEHYLDALPRDQIVETADMRLYLLDRSLIPYALAAKD